MSTNEDAPRFADISPRAAAIVAGLELLLMAILSPIAYPNTFQRLVKFEDATLLNRPKHFDSMGAFRLCILFLFIVALLDIVVAWALYILLVAANKNLSALAAWLRVIYAGFFMFAISKLYVALQVMTADGTQTMSFLKAFQSIWDRVYSHVAGSLSGAGSFGIYRRWFWKNSFPQLQPEHCTIHLC